MDEQPEDGLAGALAWLVRQITEGNREPRTLVSLVERVERASLKVTPGPRAPVRAWDIEESLLVLRMVGEHGLAERVVVASSRQFPTEARIAEAMVEAQYGDRTRGLRELLGVATDPSEPFATRLTAALGLGEVHAPDEMVRVGAMLMRAAIADGDLERATMVGSHLTGRLAVLAGLRLPETEGALIERS